MWHRHCGVAVRLTSEPRPELLLLDADRVRISAGSPHGRVHAWSREPEHVSAAIELFRSWWLSADAAFELPPCSTPRFPEPEYDVEEWSPHDVE
jgi:hypothetical protein